MRNKRKKVRSFMVGDPYVWTSHNKFRVHDSFEANGKSIRILGKIGTSKKYKLLSFLFGWFTDRWRYMTEYLVIEMKYTIEYI